MKKLFALSAILGIALSSGTAYAADYIRNSYPACISTEYLSAATNASALESLMRSGKCTILKVGTPIVMLDRGFMTIKFLYQNVELYAPSEAIR